MSRGGSYGGGQSSLGYLFGSEEQPSPPPPQRPVEPPYGVDTSSGSFEKPPVHSKTRITVDPSERQKNPNNYHRAEGQNLGNFVTVSDYLL